MEIKVTNMPRMGKMTSISKLYVRKNEETDYYLFPENEVKEVISFLEKNGLLCDVVPAASKDFRMLSLIPSKYEVGDLSVWDVVALYTDVQIDDLYELIEYLRREQSENVTLKFYKNSELQEFSVLLNEKAQKELSPEYQEVFCGYMKLLLDMEDSERMGQLCQYSNQDNIARMLGFYTETVQDFILSHVTRKMEKDIRHSMDTSRAFSSMFAGM